MMLKFYLAQLRHAYAHLAAGRVVNQKEFADGLLSPAIKELEMYLATLPAENEVIRQPFEEILELKSWSQFFAPILAGTRTSDMRSKKDRNFHIGQKLMMCEYDFAKGVYTGRKQLVEVTHIISNDTPCAISSSALDRDHVILSIRKVESTWNISSVEVDPA